MSKFVANPLMHFPSEYIQIAQAIEKRFEAQNWGEVPKEEPKTDEENTDAETPKKKAKTSATKTSLAGSSHQTAVTRLPLPNHGIFGTTGIMRGILANKGDTTSYSLDPRSHKTPFNVFGANGLIVGDWWPRQIAALRDGAHGSKGGGISGTTNDGCYSVVVSQLYEDIDGDGGDEILYSSTRGKTMDDVRANKFTKALLRSVQTRKPVRVLRASGSKWKHAPRVGIRYDGVYRVVNSKEVDKGDEGAYMQFKLLRLPGQNPIHLARPTATEREQFNRVTDGY
jgi:hypothetical protein